MSVAEGAIVLVVLLVMDYEDVFTIFTKLGLINRGGRRKNQKIYQRLVDRVNLIGG